MRIPTCVEWHVSWCAAWRAVVHYTVFVIFVLFLCWLGAELAVAHDNWINKGGFRNGAGEWCCGEGDCFMVEPVRTTANGYLILATGELIPEREAQPSPDGKFWRCKRPDGSRRCFFAPMPSY